MPYNIASFFLFFKLIREIFLLYNKQKKHMPICQKCKTEFKTLITIDGKIRNLKNRKYCLICSPYGKHNTKKLHNTEENFIPHEKSKCFICKTYKPNNHFYIRKNRKNKLSAYCKECIKIFTIKKQKEIKNKCIEYKGGKCSICGYDKCSSALDFHHINPNDKTKSISVMKSKSFEKLKSELDKCILLCKNCHFEVHVKLRNEKYELDKIKYNNIQNESDQLCIKCKIRKPSFEFYNQSETKKHKYCRACLNYETITNQRLLKKKCIDYKGGKCSICGYDKYDGSLDFHHKNKSTKEFKISSLKNSKFEKIIKELDKCIIVCKNCHSLLHSTPFVSC